MTVSRGGILAAGAGILAFYALMPNRIQRLPTLAISAAGITVLLVSLLHRAALRDSIGAAPGAQRHSMLLLLIVVLVATAALQLAVEISARRLTLPTWLNLSRSQARGITAVILAAVVALVLIVVTTGTLGRMWSSFKVWSPTVHTDQYFRLLSLGGSHRYPCCTASGRERFASTGSSTRPMPNTS
jgi:hypothetical protein